MPLLYSEEHQPKLKPPIACWREDMPENHEPQRVPSQLRWPTTRNDIYLEVPRYGTEVIWWGMLGSAVLTFELMVFMLTISVLIQNVYITLATLAVFASLLLFCLKMYFVTPRNQPLRLNRKRQKIYIFDYSRKRLPWLKWSTTVTSYNWADVHGEIRFSGTPGDRGYWLYGAVCKPGTYDVVARFLLAREWEERKQLNQIWSYLCIYMQHDDALSEPRNPEPPAFWCPRKADKWPEDMERESTTAPRVGSIAERMSEMLSVSAK